MSLLSRNNFNICLHVTSLHLESTYSALFDFLLVQAVWEGGINSDDSGTGSTTDS